MSVVGKMGKRKTMLYRQLSEGTEISKDFPDRYMEGKSLNWFLLDSTPYLRDMIDLI